jgi:hypothetical protein
LNEIEKKVDYRRNYATSPDCKPRLVFTENLLPEFLTHDNPRYARKVFVGGLDASGNVEIVRKAFLPFGLTKIQYSTKNIQNHNHTYLPGIQN